MHGEEQAHIALSAIVNFVLLAGGLIYFLRKPVSGALRKQKDDIDKAVAEAEQLRLETEKMVREYQSKIDNLNAEIDQIMSSARTEAQVEREKILERAQVAAERIRDGARRAAAQEIEAEKEAIKREVVRKAAERATILLQSKVTSKDHERIAKDFIARLEGTDGARH